MTKFDEILNQLKHLDEYEKKKLAIVLMSETLSAREKDKTIKVIQSRNKKGMI